MQLFLEFTNFYLHFIQTFSKISTLFTFMLKIMTRSIVNQKIAKYKIQNKHDNKHDTKYKIDI